METYLYYLTHLVMAVCITIIISAKWHQHIQIAISRALVKLGDISLSNNLKAVYQSLRKEEKLTKALIIRFLTIGMQITIQLLK